MSITALFKFFYFQMWSFCEMTDDPLLRVPLEELRVQLEIFVWFWSKKIDFLWNRNYSNYQSMVSKNSANLLD